MAMSQDRSWPFYYEISSGIANYKTNTSVHYRLHCPTAKIGLNLQKNWGRFGFSPSILLGIRFKSISNSPFLISPNPTQEEIYIQALNESYSTDRPVFELPLTIYYSLIKNKLSLHSGISFKRYLNRNAGPPSEDSNSKGIITMMRFKASRNIYLSLEYYYGLGILHSTYVLTNATEYHVRESYAQFSLLIRAF